MRAYIEGKWRPVQSPKVMECGPNKGLIEVWVNRMRRVGDSYKPVPRPILLNQNQIIGYGTES